MFVSQSSVSLRSPCNSESVLGCSQCVVTLFSYFEMLLLAYISLNSILSEAALAWVSVSRHVIDLYLAIVLVSRY